MLVVTHNKKHGCLCVSKQATALFTVSTTLLHNFLIPGPCSCLPPLPCASRHRQNPCLKLPSVHLPCLSGIPATRLKTVAHALLCRWHGRWQPHNPGCMPPWMCQSAGHGAWGRQPWQQQWRVGGWGELGTLHWIYRCMFSFSFCFQFSVFLIPASRDTDV